MNALRPRLVIWSAAVFLAACNSDSTGGGPTTVMLQNDSFTPGGSAPSFQQGFEAEDGAAAFFPSRTSAYSVRNVRFLFGGNATPQSVTLVLYAVTGAGPTRVPIYTSTYALTPSDDAFQEIDLSDESVEVNPGEGLLVTIYFQHDGAPSVAIDSGLTPGRNWIYVSNFMIWQTSDSFPIPGDFILRAEIEED